MAEHAHPLEDDFHHFLAYTNLRAVVPEDMIPWLRLAYASGGGRQDELPSDRSLAPGEDDGPV